MLKDIFPSHYYIQTAFVLFTGLDQFYGRPSTLYRAVIAAVIMWTTPVLWWQPLCKHLLCCDGSCCVNISCAVMAAVVMWASPVLWWKLLCEHLCCDRRCYVNISSAVTAAVVVWTSVLWWQYTPITPKNKTSPVLWWQYTHITPKNKTSVLCSSITSKNKNLSDSEWHHSGSVYTETLCFS